jgi:8-oxo-dGTP diphosphatase
MLSEKTSMKVCLILEENDQILFLEQTAKNGGKYSLIGGKVEREEFAVQSLIRESYEEAGIALREQNLELVHVLQLQSPKKSQIVLYFKASIWDGDIRSYEPKKFKQIKWIPKNKLPENISDANRMVVERYSEGKTFTNIAVDITVKMNMVNELAMC